MTLRIGTRRSRLATTQANEIATRLGTLGEPTELVRIETAGDLGAQASSSPQGRKGLFVAEIVRALLGGEIDIAVHSAKDLPAQDEPGLVIGAVPKREQPFDVFVRREANLPERATVGTSSLRRRAQLHRSRPRMRVVELRGNVDTRLEKMESGAVDALVLAAAGLIRLGITPPHQATMDADEMVPAPGQGALAVQAREADRGVLEKLEPLEHTDTRAALEAERALMARLGGGCALPLGALATVERREIHLTALVATPEGNRIVRTDAHAPTPMQAADEAAEHLLSQGAGEILDAVREAGAR